MHRTITFLIMSSFVYLQQEQKKTSRKNVSYLNGHTQYIHYNLVLYTKRKTREAIKRVIIYMLVRIFCNVTCPMTSVNFFFSLFYCFFFALFLFSFGKPYEPFGACNEQVKVSQRNRTAFRIGWLQRHDQRMLHDGCKK